MELVQSLYDFFGFEILSESATFPELLSYIMQIFIGVWIVIFIIRSLFMAITLPDRRFM